MKTLMKTLALAVCLLLPLAGALGAADSARLNGAKALVLAIDPVGHTMMLDVPSLAQPRASFSISPNCIYGNGFKSLSSLHIDSRVLIWTQAGQAGKLPAIIKINRADY